MNILGLTTGALGLVAAVAALLALYVFKARKKDMWKVVGVVGVIAVFIGGGITSSYQEISAKISSGSGSAPLVAASGTQPANAGCNVAPALTYTANDAYNASSVGATTTNIKINGAAPVSAYATGAGGDRVSYLATGSLIFSAPVDVTLPCGATSITATTIDNSTGGHTFNIFNDVGDVLTNQPAGGAINVTMGSGSAKNLKLEITAPSQKGLAPFGAAYCIEGSETVVDSSKTKFSGAPTSKPKRITLTAAANFINCVEDSTPLMDSSVVTKTLPVAAAVGQNPHDNNLIVHVVPKSWFVDSDGEYSLGFQNKNNVDKTQSGLVYYIETA